MHTSISSQSNFYRIIGGLCIVIGGWILLSSPIIEQKDGASRWMSQAARLPVLCVGIMALGFGVSRHWKLAALLLGIGIGVMALLLSLAFLASVFDAPALPLAMLAGLGWWLVVQMWRRRHLLS